MPAVAATSVAEIEHDPLPAEGLAPGARVICASLAPWRSPTVPRQMVINPKAQQREADLIAAEKGVLVVGILELEDTMRKSTTSTNTIQ